MSGELRPTRYAHSEGHTDVCYSDDGKLLVTCGEDGEVRLFQGLDDDDCVTHSIGDQAVAVAYKAPNLIVGTDSNCVQYFDAEDGVPGQVITRFTAVPTCLHVCGKLVAAGGSDMVVRVQDTLDYRDTVLEGHAAPILSVALDPKGEYVASSSCDGSVKVWFLATSSAVKTWPDLHPKSNQFRASTTLCRMAFTPSGGQLLVPEEDKVVVYSRSTWVKERHFGSTKSSTPISIVAVSACGALVATATTDGQLSVYQLSSGAPVVSVVHPKQLAVTGLVWNPAEPSTELAFVDCHGHLGTITNISALPGQSALPFPPPEVDASMDDMLADINRDEDDDNDVSLANIKAQMGFADDENGTFLGLPQGEQAASSTTPQPPSRPPSVAPPGVQLPDLQRCFTPSMTPEHHSQRYMVWNNTGVVKQYNTEEDCSIGVDFHDSSLHHSIHLSNSQHGYSLAALSQQALVLAAEASTDSASRVWVQLLSGGSTMGAEQDWQVELPQGEDVTALAASSQVVAVASDRRLVRVLSVSGAGGDVLCVPGQLVCLAAHGHLVMMLYHGGVGAAGDQQIQMLVLNTDTRTPGAAPHPVPAPCPVPLSPRSFVAWAGFSDEGSPVVVDSEGYIRMMHPRYAPGGWTVLLATNQMTKGRSDHHFVLGVSESEGKVRSILCRGTRYPPVVPPPYVTLLDFKVPVFDESSEKGELEAAVLASDLQQATLSRTDLQLATPGMDLTGLLQEADLLLQTTLIKLFALACRSDRPLRAQHVCRSMNARTLQSAVKYAAKLGRGDLAETIADYAEERRLREEELLEEEQRLTGLPSSGYIHASNSSQQLSLLATPTPAVIPTPSVTSSAVDAGEVASDSGSEGDEDVDTVPPTGPADSNPLLAAAAARRSKQHNLSLDPSMLPSKVNPFRKAPPAAAGGNGFQGLDGYKPKIDSSAPILRPVLKKKSKAERALKKSQTPKESSQPSIKSNFTQSFITGKENKLAASQADPAPDLLDSSTKADVDEASDASSIPCKFSDSSLFRSTAALHLWWADNEETVRGADHDKDLKLLVPRAALLFKDLPDSVKAKYKRLASQNATEATSEAVGLKESDNKRKREDEVVSTVSSTPDLDNSTLKKQKPASGISKLAAFAFNKE